MRGFPKGYRYEHQGVRPTRATCNDGSTLRMQRFVLHDSGKPLYCKPGVRDVDTMSYVDETTWDWEKL